MDKKYIVYCHTNKINGKRYVGITSTSLVKRFGKDGSQYQKCRKFWSAIQKYGWDNFHHNVLYSNLSKEEAESIEIKLIKDWNLMDSKFGYNIREGGSTTTLSKESREKLSKAHLGKKFTPERRERHRNAMKKMFIDHPELREKRGIITKKRFEDNPELREKYRQIGIKRYEDNPELREEMSRITKERYKNPEFRKQQSERIKKFFNEHPEKVSRSMLGKHHSDETKRKIATSNRGKTCTEEQKEKMKNTFFKKGSTPWNKGKKMDKAIYEKSKNTMFKKGHIPWCAGKKFTEEQRLKQRGKNAIKVLCVELNKVFESAMQADRELGISHSTIISCCKHRLHYNTAGGYHWEYFELKGE